ncbi:hypothetical protein FW754_13940 [Acinetobacter sp. 1207_04]|uniref:hypothetical protein n=1 Tax=Acinetobacter sp. 1207_04 TaxID=2604449 RepID=UPI004058E026
MINNITEDGSKHVPIGGDFAKVFTSDDYIALVNSTDTSGVVLRAHLILEDFINIWCSKITGTEDLFDGPFIGFKTKLNIAKNLGLDQQLYNILDKFNAIRNKYSHRRQYKLEQSAFDSLVALVNSLPSKGRFLPCEELSITIGGIDRETNERVVKEFLWNDADLNKRIVILFVQLTMKFLLWMQSEFDSKAIAYELISDFPIPQ